MAVTSEGFVTERFPTAKAALFQRGNYPAAMILAGRLALTRVVFGTKGLGEIGRADQCAWRKAQRNIEEGKLPPYTPEDLTASVDLKKAGLV